VLDHFVEDRLMSNSHRTWLAPCVLAILLLVGACGATPAGPVTQGDATHGQALWAQSTCMGCHGVNAQGSTGGPALADTPLTIRDVTNIVRRGGPGMPKYPASQISDQDLQDLYAWFQNPVPAATGGPGQDPWTQSACAGCHGVNALGGSGPSLAGTGQPFAAFQTVVRQGARDMPPFSETQMSDQTLQAIYAWLQAQTQVPPSQQVPAAQQTLWAQVGCGACHGANAEGGTAPTLTGKELSYDRFRRVVREGEEGMPAYSTSQLSDADLQALYDWLMALP
jgi:mono/diheme cytochrome c family protein